MEEPEFNYILDGFKITFYSSDQGKMPGLGSQKGSGKTSGKTSGKILSLIRNDRNITIPELSRQIGITERSIQRAIQILQKEHVLKRIGGRKIGYWEIIED